MPEGPEIKLNWDLLNRLLAGKELVGLEFLSGKYVDKSSKFEKVLVGHRALVRELPLKVVDVGRRGKFIWWEMENGMVVGISFGMSGRFSQDGEAKHQRVEVDVRVEGDGVGGGEPFYYVDARNFGSWQFWKDDSELKKKLDDLGFDILDDDNLKKEEVVTLFRKYDRQEITQALMSQKVLAGVGNYIKAEALYRAKIWPYAKVSELSDSELWDLYRAAVEVAKASYETQKDWIEWRAYTDYQEYMEIYNAKEDRQGREVVRVTDTKDKRTTWWVPEVQVRGK